jgi:glutamine synthetase
VKRWRRPPSRNAAIDVKDIEDLVRKDEIDTVLVVFPDMMGRLVGKRVTAHYFLDEMVEGDGMHACNYLLAVDSEMEPLPGYRFASWETGYPDLNARPDMSTLRLIPWLEKTALVMCDLLTEQGEVVDVAPRQILKAQVKRAADLGYTVNMGAELEFYLFRDSYEEAASKGYRDLVPHSNVNEDYHILQTTRDEYLIRQIRNGMDGAGVPVEFSKGEAGRGQHEINLVYAEPVEMADRLAVYKNGVKEIAAMNQRAITFMAKASMTESGSSLHIHSSLWDGDKSLMWAQERPERMSEVFEQYLAGLIATASEMAWMYAPYVNSYKRYQPGWWAPTAIVWDHDNRTAGYRIVGHGPSYRVECRIPGADANPYLAFAATIAGGLHGIQQKMALGPRYRGNAYAAEDVPRVPWNIVEAADAFEKSEVARAAFGEDVHHHLLNTARQEWARSNQVVTDWELRRNFELA